MVALVPAVSIAAGPVPAPVDRCAIDDPRLVELSGLAVVGSDSTEKPPPDGVGFSDKHWALWAMADGGRRVELLRLDPDTCAVVERRTAAVDPYDAEDLAAAPDGSLWVGDTGDNDRRRATVAVIVVPPRGAPELHRLTYPDGPHDAEALLVDARGVPTIVTKGLGVAGVYRPEGALTGAGPVPLVHVGDVVLPSSDTAGGPIGGFGSRTVTGGAVSADGRVVALRTYTDAWLYAVPDPVPDGRPDAITAALLGSPVRVPLPDEPQGEALAFTADGTLLSGSESRGGATGQIRAVPGAAALATAYTPPSTPIPPGTPVAAPAPTDEPVPGWRPAAIGAAALVAVLGVLAAAMARHTARRH